MARVETVTTSDWWCRALAGEAVPITDGCPEAGYYKTKRVRGGPWVPARVWIERERDDDGEQIEDDRFRCLIDGTESDAVQEWVRLSAHPIAPAEYERLRRNPDPLPSNRPVTLKEMAPLF